MDNVFIPGAPFDEREYDLLKSKFPKDYQELLSRVEPLKSSEKKFNEFIENCAFLD